MGIEDVRPSQVNNHIFAISPEGSYMWATDYCIGFVYTYLNNILLKENVMANKDNAWGAHEIRPHPSGCYQLAGQYGIIEQSVL